ncbi:MAG: NAD(+)/NADH kinase [Deltaproteobacteria bacterium]|nr:NAD(+)/NADH kinase [Deltaproteobacteria bacterium]
MHIAVVWNGRAGSAAGLAIEDVTSRLRGDGGHEVTVFEVSEDRSPTVCTRDAVASGATVVVAAGGDGTVSSVASALVGGTTKLAVLPLGTANSFAAALGIPADLDEAIALVTSDQRCTIDAAMVRGPAGERAMILHCMIGIHADTVGETTTEAKQRWGVLAYAGSALRQLAKLEGFSVELQTTDHVIRCRAIAVGVANLAPPHCVLAHGPSHLLGDDGRVDVTIVAAETIAEAIATGIHLYRSAREGAPASRDNVGSFSTARVAITAEPTQRVLIDGEPFGDTPVTIETMPGALTVVAPPAAVADGPMVEAPLYGLPELEIDGQAVG